MKERRLPVPARLGLLLVALAAASSCAEAPSLIPPAAAGNAPVFGDAFWNHWGDGRGELAGYDLTFPRYGELRRGVAVAVFVTETFSSSLRVKADPGKHPASDEFPVMKLNLIESFPTGIYDYNLFTSSFIALAGVNGLPAGAPAKVSFSAQEWCGHVYSQLLFDRSAVRQVLHSYFDGEADRTEELPHPAGGLSEDALLMWARGLAAPVLAPGETREAEILGSFKLARLGHRGVAWQKAKLTRQAGTIQATVPAGTFEAEVRTGHPVRRSGRPHLDLRHRGGGAAPDPPLGVHDRREGRAPRQRPAHVLEDERRRLPVGARPARARAPAAAHAVAAPAGAALGKARPSTRRGLPGRPARRRHATRPEA